MVTIDCPHCGAKVHRDLDDKWKSFGCSNCGEAISRENFMVAAPSSEKFWPATQREEENARSLRSIAVSLQVLAGVVVREDGELEELYVGVLDGAVVDPFEE